MVSDEALVERLRNGDMSAFDALYGRYERRLFGFILRHLGDRQEAEDVFHEAFLALLGERKGAHATHSLRAWLYTVARNLCLNRLRSRRRAARAVAAVAQAPAEPTRHPDRAIEERESVEALRCAVSRLPLPLAELFELRAHGLSYEELAAVLGLPLGTVKSRMHQMVGLLREELQR